MVAAIQAAEQETGGEVRFFGPVYGDGKLALFEAADIFAFPSRYRYECQPLSLIEAMAHGLPIVSTAAGASGQLVAGAGTADAAGLVVPQGDPAAFADALAMLIGEPDLRLAYARQGRARFERDLSLARFETRLTDCFAAIVAAGRSRKGRAA